ncbi:unnamed protein product, partial [Callosobruchus maculatus]
MFIKKSTTPTVAARMTRKPGKERMLFSSKLDDVYEGGRLPTGSVLVGIWYVSKRRYNGYASCLLLCRIFALAYCSVVHTWMVLYITLYLENSLLLISMYYAGTS